MRLAIVLMALVGPTSCTRSPAADADQLRALADSHQWFALRDAVQNMAHPPLLYRGAVACAFNDVKRCEQDMQRVVHGGSAADRADAHGFLMVLDAMAGRFRLAMIDSKERLKLRGTLSAPDGLHAVLSAFGQYADLTVVSRRPSSVPYERAAGHLLIPVSINGGSARYILDTGANFSGVTESEAKRLGLKTSEVHAHNLGDSTGRGFSLGKLAIADRMEIGNLRLKNVPFMVVDDDLDAFAELPADARGAIGMQVLLACGTIRWNSAGTVELGGHAERASVGRANLCFDGLQPLAEGSFGSAKLVFVLDTGDSESHLSSRFAREFAALVKERGKPDTWSLSGLGGTVEAQTTILPDFRLEVGGLAAALQPVHVLGKVAGSEFHHGVIGMDFLDQATEVTIDFRAMRMTLANPDSQR
jgi:clan AA aspartic protease (TIGR02281 family)